MNSENINDRIPVLSIETSSSLCGACVYFNNEKYFQSLIHLKNVHAEKLLDLVDEVLKSSETDISDLKSIAVSNGPGSFTGLRIGMSAAKGLGMGADLPIIQVPTFEAIALQISKYLPDDSVFIIGNKVNRDEVYFAKFQIKANSYIFVENLKILSFKEFLQISKDLITFGNAVKKENQLNYKPSTFAPQPVYIAEWAQKYGKVLTKDNIDLAEPYYLKNFTIKVSKND